MTVPVSWRVLVGSMCLVPSAALCQRAPSTQQLFSSLRSPDPMARASALEALHATRGALSRPGASAALLETLERENQLIARTWLESHGTEGVVDTYGEEYGEYVSQLAGDCFKHCDLRDPRAVIALGDAYPAENKEFEQLAARHGTTLLPRFLEATTSSDEEMRRIAVEKIAVVDAMSRTLSARERERADSIVLAGLADHTDSSDAFELALTVGTMAEGDVPLSTERRTVFHDALVALARSPDELQRIAAIRSLGKFRDRADLPLLLNISGTDTVRRVSAGKANYPVRVEAAKAIALIRRPK